MSTTAQHVLVTGATSGLGFEAAAQLAESGHPSVVIAGRTTEKAQAAVSRLVERTGKEVFSTLAFDTSDSAAARAAVAELAEQGQPFDGLILNAGAVMTEKRLTGEGIETTFGASILGHHILTSGLIEAGLLTDRARVVIVGSEAANNDLPKMMGFAVSDFALSPPTSDADFTAKLAAFARGEEPAKFDANDQYATTKVVSAWWAAGMQRRHEGRFDFFNVSPGANLGTEAARHITGPQKLMFGMMAKFGHLIGMNMPVEQGAGRYISVFTGAGEFAPGGTFTSKPKKMTGPLARRTEGHLTDARRQDLAVGALDDLAAELAAA